MMKYDCEIIKDLLPLYCDGVCSEQSKNAVEEHLKVCESCKKTKADFENCGLIPEVNTKEEKSKINFIKSIRKKLNARKIIISIVSAALTVAVISGVYYVLTIPKKPIEYYDGMVIVEEKSNDVDFIYNGKAFASIESVYIPITVDGEEKNVVCFRYLENLYSKYLDSGNSPFTSGNGSCSFNIYQNDIDMVYYGDWDGLMAEDADPETTKEIKRKIVEESVLLWKSE